MKPNFALSLSFDGIQLLHRALGGWRVVGEVALDAADLDAELATLRKTATALDPGGLRCKLLIPDAQIKYLSIDAEDPSDAARLRAAHLALEGATPYALDELAFDIAADGARTHIAAVARDTLEEAESFAVEHRFHPVSFVAAPKRGDFPGEPFFGPTAAAAELLEPGETVEPDSEAVVVLDIASATARAAQHAPVADLTDMAKPSGPDSAPTEKPATGSAARAATAPAAPSSAAPGESQKPLPTSPADWRGPAVPTKAMRQEDVGSRVAKTGPAQKDPSAETSRATPSTTVSAQPDRAVKTTMHKPVAAQEASPPERPAASGQTRSSAGHARPHGESPTLITPEAVSASLRPAAPAAARINAPELVPGSYSTAPRRNAAQRLVAFASRRPKAGSESRREPLVAPPAPPPAAVPVTTTPVLNNPGETTPVTADALPGQPATPRPAGARAALQAETPAHPAQQAPPTRDPLASEEEQMTIFGARKSEVGGKPRYLGLMLTAALLMLLAGVAAWASVFLDDGINLSRLFGDRAEPRLVADAPREPDAETDSEAESVARSSAGTAKEAETIAARPEAEGDETPIVSLSAGEEVVTDSLSAPRGTAQSPLSAAEAEAKYAVSGIWPLAPQLPSDPAALVRLENLRLASIDPVSRPKDADALPPVASFDSDVMRDDLDAPVAAETDPARDDRGLVVASAEGALNPDGVKIYLGRPAAVPPARPTAEAEDPVQDTPETSAVAQERPRERPEDLVASAPTPEPESDPVGDSSLAGLRPKPRETTPDPSAPPISPGGVAVTLQETDDAVTIALTKPAAFQNATPQATEVSRRPDDRPRNFAQIVKTARRSAPAVVSAPSAVVAPSIPSKTSVAKQATVKNAINLRKINLIGVYGKPANRRALVRLGNGRYQKVEVGDRIDGGRVAAISESELHYVKRGRSVVLQMPKS
ncbi:hypothetical protein ACFSUD_02620 [Sulfitobacter aestuarii]|uniref:Type IV pilus biogenesis n=1 Tax=Sulfitobacter aestuarii TaxID=2161676 RepID=A0ABW5TXT8_9RHOB